MKGTGMLVGDFELNPLGWLKLFLFDWSRPPTQGDSVF